MTDLEIIRKCAEKMGYKFGSQGLWDGGMYDEGGNKILAHASNYDPLTDDAQCMALVKKFELNIGPTMEGYPRVIAGWLVSQYNGDGEVFSQDLNKAVCECVARMP